MNFGTPFHNSLLLLQTRKVLLSWTSVTFANASFAVLAVVLAVLLPQMMMTVDVTITITTNSLCMYSLLLSNHNIRKVPILKLKLIQHSQSMESILNKVILNKVILKLMRTLHKDFLHSNRDTLLILVLRVLSKLKYFIIL
jgi:hypothetical protein